MDWSSLSGAIAAVSLLLGSAAAGASLVGGLPRAGPMRALIVAFRSKVRWPVNPPAIRETSVQNIRNALAHSQQQTYCVVTGPKGVGKSCVLRSATDNTFGVIEVEVGPGKDVDTIVDLVLYELTGILELYNPIHSARRVIWWYKLVAGKGPIIVIHASERTESERYSNLVAAARRLTEKLGLRVIIDGAPNSLQPQLFESLRETVLEIEPMTKDMLWQLPQFQNIFKAVKGSELEMALWEVLGGVPAQYISLSQMLEQKSTLSDTCSDPDKALEIHQRVVQQFLCDRIFKAMKEIDQAVHDHADVAKILQLYIRDSEVTLQKIAASGLKRPSPDKVFQTVIQGERWLLVPASNAISIAIRHGFQKRPAFKDLLSCLKMDADSHKLIS